MSISTDKPPSFDSILLVSFGGPEGPDDVMPFLENVLRGKNVPRSRMLEVAEHYQQFGGVSPINQQNRDLIEALKVELDSAGIDLPIYWGNRNWHPLLVDTLHQMQSDGRKRAIAFFTSMFSSYSGCRQYRENVADAQRQLGELAPRVEKVRKGFNHPLFVQAQIEMVTQAINQLRQEQLPESCILFTAHSIPLSMAEHCQYEKQLQECSRLVAEGLRQKGSLPPQWEVVYQSRSGPAAQPWLEPDICDRIEELAKAGIRNVVVVPLGFVSDHIEVLFDLDTEAKQLCEQLGVQFLRAPTVGTCPAFVRLLRELIEERVLDKSERPVIGQLAAVPDLCPEDCCLYPRPQRPKL